MSTFIHRAVGAAALKTRIYEEVEADRGATGQAVCVVVLASVAAGLGTPGGGSVAAAAAGTIGALVGWMAWAVLTSVIGTRFLPEPQTRADVGELLRTLGFAAAPGVLRVFGLVPRLAGLVYALTAMWMLAATVVAVRQALDYRSTGRAIAVCVAGWALSLAIAAVIGLLFAPAVS